MKQGLLVFLAICAFAIAMVPRDRRAVNTEEQKETFKEDTRVTCQDHTPCAWFAYKTHVKIIAYNITNEFCSCGHGTSCVKDDDDERAEVFVYRCRKPGHADEKDDN